MVQSCVCIQVKLTDARSTDRGRRTLPSLTFKFPPFNVGDPEKLGPLLGRIFEPFAPDLAREISETLRNAAAELREGAVVTRRNRDVLTGLHDQLLQAMNKTVAAHAAAQKLTGRVSPGAGVAKRGGKS